jgi:integrase
MGRKRKESKDEFFLPPGVYRDRGSYYFYVPRLNKKKVQIAHVGQEKEMRIRWAQLYHPIGEKTCITMKDVVERYLAEVSITKAETTQEHERYSARRVIAVFGSMGLDDITPQQIHRAMDEIKGKSIANANRFRSFLSECFYAGIRWGAGTKNYCREVKPYKQPTRKRVVTQTEFMAVYEIANDLMRAYMKISFLCGRRGGDARKIKLSDITEEGIYFHADKTGKKQLVEWSAELRKAIDEAKAIRKDSVVRGAYLFTTRYGKPYTKDGIGSAWQRLQDAAMGQVEDRKGNLLPNDKQPAPVISERFTLHDLRSMAADSVSLEHAAQLLDHSDSNTTKKWYRRKEEIKRVKPVK